jgi:hypothetical protein
MCCGLCPLQPVPAATSASAPTRALCWCCPSRLQLLLRLNLAQLDDMMHGTAFPVVMVPADKNVAEDSAAEPLLFFTHVTQPSRFRGALYTPTLVAHVAALRLQVSETLVWRTYAFLQGLAAGSGSTAAAAGSGSRGVSSGSAAAGGMRGAGGSKARLAQAGSSSNLSAAGGGAGSAAGAGQGGGSGGGASGDVQQVASADLPLQVSCSRLSRSDWGQQLWPGGLQTASCAIVLQSLTHCRASCHIRVPG